MADASSVSRTASSFRVQVLGPFALERDGAPLDTSKWQRRVRNLFTLLAIAPGHRRSRDAIIDLLWPDATPEAGAGNLRLVAHRLRLALGGGDPSPILLEHGWVALNPAHNWEVDLERFEALVRAVRDDIPALEKAVELYHGEPLREESYEDWAMTAVPISGLAERRSSVAGASTGERSTG